MSIKTKVPLSPKSLYEYKEHRREEINALLKLLAMRRNNVRSKALVAAYDAVSDHLADSAIELEALENEFFRVAKTESVDTAKVNFDSEGEGS